MAVSTLQIGVTGTPGLTGGIGRYFFALVDALGRLGYPVRGVVVGAGPETVRDGSRVESVSASADPMPRRWKALRRRVREALRPDDVFVSHFAPYAFPLLDIAREHRSVVHFHGPWAAECAAEGAGRVQTLARTILERAVYARGTGFIVLSRAYGSILERSYGVSPSRIHVVPGGVDLAQFSPGDGRAAARRRLGLPLDRPILITARRLVPQKGVQLLIEAVDRVRREVPDVLLVVAGSGFLAERLASRVRERRLDRHVCMVGFIESALADYYRAADLSVVPSTELEGFGLVVIESLACGTPVLVTPVGGMEELVNDFDRSLVMKGTAVVDLAEGMLAALSSRRELPDAGRCAAFAAGYAWPIVADRVSAIYGAAN